jgi:5-bromo-4-chloroindolyl phosphate hydrolysis protein
MIDDNYNYNSAGQGVDVYIIDTYAHLSAPASVVTYYTTTRTSQANLHAAILLGRDLHYVKKTLRKEKGGPFKDWLAKATNDSIKPRTARQKISLWEGFRNYPLLCHVSAPQEEMARRSKEICDYLEKNAEEVYKHDCFFIVIQHQHHQQHVSQRWRWLHYLSLCL